MTKQFFKTVLAGILAGVLIFMMPFLLIKVLIFFLLIRAIFRLMGGGHRKHWRYAYAHKFQNMSEEERKAFMENHAKHCGSWHGAGSHCGWGYKDDQENTAGSEEKDKTNNV